MAQIQQFEWTNPNPAVARNLNVGFTVAKVEIWDLTTPARYEWTSNMADAHVFDLTTDAYTTTNGVTPLAQDAAFGPSVSGFTNASPGVLTVNDTETFGIVAGDTIKVCELADDGAGTSLNGQYTVASVTATTITLNEATNSGYSAYVSGGSVVRVSDSSGNPIPIENKAIRGVTLGTSAVGANSADMVAMVYGQEPVV